MTKGRKKDDKEFGDYSASFLLLLKDFVEKRLTRVGVRYDGDHVPVVPCRHIDCVSVEEIDEKKEWQGGSDKGDCAPFSGMFAGAI
jgi:hypothetical protein